MSMDGENYLNSSSKRPKKVSSGGSGVYCCIPQCGSATYDRDGKKSGIGFFKFPKEKSEFNSWKRTITHYRRKGVGDNFNINAQTVVCEFHFKAEEIRVSLGIGRKTLVKGAVPSIFRFKSNKVKSYRKSPCKRNITEPHLEESTCQADHTPDNVIQERDTDEPCFLIDSSTPYECKQCSKYKVSLETLEEKNKVYQDEMETLKNENLVLKQRIFVYENISQKQQLFKSFTGLEKINFDILWDFVNPGENCERLMSYEPSRRTGEDIVSPGRNEQTKRGRKPKLLAINQLFMFLVWLKNGLSLELTSWLFDSNKSTVSRIIITWINYLYFTLGAIPIWPTRSQIQDSMPESFRKTYPKTRCIIDCTELFCQSPSSLKTQSSLYSHYKHHATYKGLVGISPSGAITFISQLYDGSISDKDIVAKSGLLDPRLWESGDSCMADRGFTIEDDLKKINVELNIPAFLSGRDQLTKAEVKESQSIASVRIHVERAIRRIKQFKQLRNEIPLVLHGSVNQLWTVTCLLCNFLSPLIQKGYEDEE